VAKTGWIASFSIEKMIWDIKYKNEIKKREISGKYNPIVLALLKNRGIEAEEEVDNFFNFNYENLTDPLEILGMKEALERIELAKNKKEKIAIYGDYDADGVTASALLRETLENLGFSEVLIYIPDRQTEGYGMNEAAIAYIKQKGASLIITVDCGITSAREVEKAKELGIDVIITDHHHAPPEIPKAVAVINPHLNNSGFKFRDFAGVGVAFKLAQAVYKKISPDKIEQLKWSLDLVAIGTIADCVNLLSENRILVKYGLLVLSKTKRAGLQEMFKVGRIIISENDVPNAHKVAFQIAPRINAAGRMDHANIAFNLLIEKDKIKAREMSLELESKNQERQKITADIVKKIEMIANNSFRDKKIIFAENLHWPVGILGLVAGKTAENFKKPTVILQKQEKEYVGSLRSIPEVDIMEVLEECS